MEDKQTLPEPWALQAGETDNAFQAFGIYRDLGPGRSLAKTAKKLGKNTTTVEEWSAKFHWVERALAWDEEQDRQFRDANITRQVEISKELGDKILTKLINMQWDDIPDRELPRYVEVWMKLARLLAGQATESTHSEVEAKVDTTEADATYAALLAAILAGSPAPSDRWNIPPAPRDVG